MKKTATFFLGLFLVACQHQSGKQDVKKQEEQSPKGPAKFAIHKDFHNFGTLHEGEIVSFSFWLKSTGESDLRVLKTETDCRCLQVEFPEKGIMPGDSAYFEVIYHSAGDIGKQLKTVRMFTNAEKEIAELHVAANVLSEWIDLNN